MKNGSNKKNNKCLAPQKEKFCIEGTISHQAEILEAKTKYGNACKARLVPTKYFGDETDVPTLVCSNDVGLVLGKPRFPEHFTKNEYRIEFLQHGCMYSVSIRPTT